MAIGKIVMAMLATDAAPTRDQLRGLTRDQLSWLTRDQLSWLTGDQLSWLTRDQLRGLTGAQLSWLTRDQLRGLTGDQLRGLTGDQAIPVLPNLYSRILADIEESKRKLNQATFGPDCDTPMCIAGHTVNLAGAEGYKLKDLFGFSTAARLIHFASRPDVAPPRYDSYANEWALAYIEARAAEEKKGG